MLGRAWRNGPTNIAGGSIKQFGHFEKIVCYFYKKAHTKPVIPLLRTHPTKQKAYVQIFEHVYTCL